MTERKKAVRDLVWILGSIVAIGAGAEALGGWPLSLLAMGCVGLFLTVADVCVRAINAKPTT